jgi:glycosyltransferase involved in cell wall biosynthesis
MNILFAHNNADLYGSSRSLLRLSSRLVKDGHAVSAVLPFDGPLGSALREIGVTVYVLPEMAVIERSIFKTAAGLLSFACRLPLSVFRLMRLIRKIGPDIVHSNTSVMIASALAGRFSRVRTIWHIREFYTDFPGFWKIYQQIMSFCSDRIICVSAAVQQQFSGRIQRKTIVLHNGFPNEEFIPVDPGRIDAFKQQYGLAGFRLVGLVGRIILQRKGQDVFVQAAALLKERFPDVRFLLIGSCYPGNEFHGENLNRMVEELGVGDVVIQTGEVEDVKAAYSVLDISVLASAKPEPFGGVTIESMAFRKPVIGTNVGGTPEQIADGETGILVPPNDPQAMADALDRLLAAPDRARQMGAAGRKRFEEHFEFEPFYRKVQELYEIR